MGKELIRWDNAGPVRRPQKVTLLRPGPGETLRVALLSESFTGLWLHWVDGRTVPCLGEERGCPYHVSAEDWDLRWKGYAACARSRVYPVQPPLVEVTADAWNGCPILKQLSDARLCRGVMLELTRGRGGPRKRVTARLPDANRVVDHAGELPPSPDVRTLVMVLYPERVIQPKATRKEGSDSDAIPTGEIRTPDTSSDETTGAVSTEVEQVDGN